jgi:predicted transcriptional regulator
MIIKRKKETPPNDSRLWSKGDRKTLKAMVKEGKTLKDIAEELGRTPAAVQYQKSAMGLVKKDKKVRMKTKEGKKIEVNVSAEVLPDKEMTPRDNAKELARVARGIARANGKRITMAMFFVEDL